MRELARQSPPERNLVSWMASLELDPSSGNVARVVLEVRREYPGPEHARVREVFRVWLLGAAESWGIDDDALELVKSLKEAEMIYAGVEKLKREHFARLARARAKILAEGQAEGQASLIRRQARLKFGAATADRLASVLDGISEPERFVRIGDLIIECETGVELLERVHGS